MEIWDTFHNPYLYWPSYSACAYNHKLNLSSLNPMKPALLLCHFICDINTTNIGKATCPRLKLGFVFFWLKFGPSLTSHSRLLIKFNCLSTNI